MMHTVQLERYPSAVEASAMVRDILPDGPGEYRVELMAKGAPKGVSEIFAEPFLRQLERTSTSRLLTVRESIWHVLDRWLTKAGVHRPSDADPWLLQETLFDVTRASAAHVVGIRIPDRYRTRLTRLGVSAIEQEQAFPTIAYRMGRIRSYLDRHTRLSYPEILRMARQQILTPRELAAEQWARQRAGLYLQPVMDATGQAWATTRELRPLRTLLSHGVAERAEISEMVSTYHQTQRAIGTQRDGVRVIRTEIATCRAMGAWTAEIAPLDDTASLYRVPSSEACRGCLKLWLLADGTPHLYTKADFEAGEALGYNTGDWRQYHPVIGAVHPNCACSPCQPYLPEMAGVFARYAAARMKLLGDLKVFA